jgi:hypothetical protein
MEPFNARFAERVRTYTNPAAERRIDVRATSRAAMSSRPASGWLQRGLDRRSVGRGVADGRWVAAVTAAVVIGTLGIALVGRPPDTAGPRLTVSPVPSPTGPVPEALRHTWQRPAPVLPGLDGSGSGFLTLARRQLEVGPIPGAASRSAVGSAGTDTLVATATAETQGCSVNESGAYRWSVKGQGTVMTLTAISADTCTAREKALAGPWVRADLPLPPTGAALAPGTYPTAAFDPFDAPGVSGQMSYTVPGRWKVKEDIAAAFLLHRLPDDSASQPSADIFIHLFTHVRLMGDYAEGATCGEATEAPGVGRRMDDMVAAIVARPGVVSTSPGAVTIGGYKGLMLDLELAPTWTGTCNGREGRIIAMPLLLGPESERSAGIGLIPDSPVRVILLDLSGGRTMAVAIFGGGPSEPADFEKQVADAMRVIETFEFHPPAR